eukprot:GHVS01087791.1.p1 GENE.GHVS01087791.1~~GHVS01087791.1.p1  ORF type:complete len:138 (+),score=10.67 GHVS01087791.1:310-723(+)
MSANQQAGDTLAWKAVADETQEHRTDSPMSRSHTDTGMAGGGYGEEPKVAALGRFQGKSCQAKPSTTGGTLSSGHFGIARCPRTGELRPLKISVFPIRCGLRPPPLRCPHCTEAVPQSIARHVLWYEAHPTNTTCRR